MVVAGVKTQWDEKYLREQPFMAFGSMMNAFGRLNEGKGMPLEAFIIASDTIFKATQKYALAAFNTVHREDDMDLPKKKT